MRTDPDLKELFGRIRKDTSYLALKGVQESDPNNGMSEIRKQLQQIAQLFPESLPDEMDTQGMALCEALLHSFDILQGMLPLDSPDEWVRVLYMLDQVVSQLKWLIGQKGIKFSALVTDDTKKLQRLEKRLTRYQSVSKGLPVMRDLLGMPTPKKVNGEHFFRSSDASLRSMYHRWAENASKAEKAAYPELLDMIEQYESRCYLRPMWKSHAEFNFYVQGWKEDWFSPLPSPRSKASEGPKEVEDGEHWNLIEALFCRNSISPTPIRKSSNVLYTYISDSTIHRYNKDINDFWKVCKETFRLTTLVYVPQQIRHKELDCGKTYVVWKNRIVTLQDIGFRFNQNNGRNYFYFYYRCEQPTGAEPIGLDVVKFMDFLRDSLIKLEQDILGTPLEAGENTQKESEEGGSNGNG